MTQPGPGEGPIAAALLPLEVFPRENLRFLSIDVTPDEVVWAVGTGGAIYFSWQGRRFVRVASGTRRTLYRVMFSSSLVASIEGWGGFRLVTRDGGNTWQRTSASLLPGAEKILQYVSYSSGGATWAVGELRGTVLMSSDRGHSWKTVGTGRKERFRAIAFSDEFTGFVAGDGVLLTTMDGGMTWSPALIEPQNWFAVDARAGGVAVAVGEGGAVVGTRDAGQSWHQIRCDATDGLYAVRLLGDFFGYVAGDNGQIFRLA